MDYARMQQTALRLLTNAGQTMTLRHLAPGPYADGAVALTPTEETVTGAIIGYGDYARANELVEANDSRVYLAGYGITAPSIADELVDAAGKVYRVIRVSKIDPTSAVPVIYDLQVRG